MAKKQRIIKYRKSGSKKWKEYNITYLDIVWNKIEEIHIEMIAEDLNLDGDYEFNYNNDVIHVKINKRVEVVYEAIIITEEE